MQKQQRVNVLHRVALAILALWGLSALFRMMWFTATAWSDIGLWVMAAFGMALLCSIAWGLVRKVRTGKVTTMHVEQAFTDVGGPWLSVINTWYSVIVTGFLAGLIASLIAVIEFNNPFSREALDQVAGEHPVLFWAIVGAAFIIGAGGSIWTIAVSGKASSGAESATEPKAGVSEKLGRTNG